MPLAYVAGGFFCGDAAFNSKRNIRSYSVGFIFQFAIEINLSV